MSGVAKRGRVSKRGVNVFNDDKSSSEQQTEKSVKREEETVSSAQSVVPQQKTKKKKIELELENAALNAENDKLKKENADLQASLARAREDPKAAEAEDDTKSIPQIDFTDPNDPRHDMTLVIGGKKIYVSKQYLSLHSPFFNTLFHGDFSEKNKKEIELKDVNREEFLVMLYAIHPPFRRITDDSIEYLLKLGDRFQISFLMDLLEKILNDARTLKRAKKLEIANQYGLKIVGIPDDGVMNKVKSVVPNEPIDFTDSNEPRHDVALVIDGEKIYASKQYLAVHSPFFNELFYHKVAEKNKKEFELKDVNRKEFLEMLNVIYPSRKEITEDSAEYLLHLGNQFQIAYVVERSEEFLCSDDCDITAIDKLRIADQYRLVGLQEDILSFVDLDELKDIQESPIFRNLSKEATDAFVEKIMDLLCE